MTIDTLVKDSADATITNEPEGYAVWANGLWIATFHDEVLAQEYVDCKFIEGV